MRTIIQTKDNIFQLTIGDGVIITPMQPEPIRIDGKLVFKDNLPVCHLLPQTESAVTIPFAQTKLWSAYGWNAALLNQVGSIYRRHHKSTSEPHWQPPKGYVGRKPGLKAEKNWRQRGAVQHG